MGLFRLILAISVLIDHSNPIFGFSLMGGRIAVEAFFIISGFYIALILEEKYIGKNNSYRLFISNRFLRIFPLYWIILAIIIAYSLITILYSSGNRFGFLDYHAQYFNIATLGTILFLAFSNLFIFFQDLVMFLGFDITTGNLYYSPDFQYGHPRLYLFLFIPQAWSIAIELTFYLIAPFIIRKGIKFIIALFFLTIALKFILIHIGLNEDPWSYRFFPVELGYFLLGIIAYRIYTHLKKIQINPIYSYIIFGLMLLYTLLYKFAPFQGDYYLVTFFLALPLIFLLTKNWKFDRYIGELSYPVYLSHIFILVLIHVSKIPVFGERGLALLIFTILFSIILNEIVVKKIEIIRQKRLL